MKRERQAVRASGSWLAALVLLASVIGVAGIKSEPVSARAKPTPRCLPEYGLQERGVPRSSPSPTAVALTVGWVAGTEGRRPCAVQTTIRVAVIGSSGVAARARWRVKAVLAPWSATVHTWSWRNWCPADQGDGTVTVTFTVPSGRSVKQSIFDPPTCAEPGAPTVLDELGTGTKHVQRPAERIPPHLLPPGAPPPLPAALITVKNAWLVSDGYTLVAVYAGYSGNDPSMGRFLVIRQNEIFGVQYVPDVLAVRKAGALKLTRLPTGRSRETSAQHGELSFTSARGVRGVLRLSTDTVRLARAPSRAAEDNKPCLASPWTGASPLSCSPTWSGTPR